jgi:hypothetical protein
VKQRAIPVVTAEEFELRFAENPRLLHDSPWVVNGYSEHWPGYRKWREIDYLRSRLGALKAFAKAPNFVTHVRDELVSVETDFARYLDYISDPDRVRELYEGHWLEGSYEAFAAQDLPLYCGTLRFVHSAQDPIFDEFKPLVPRPIETWNHALPYYYSLFNHLWLLVSLPGALTPLHVDNNGTIALIAQLRGRKRATLYSPDDHRHVYNPAVGYLDPERPDAKDFPTWQDAEKWTADVEEGQVLFVGTGWAHHVCTVEKSISISFDFVDASNLADYARSADWAMMLGKRVQKNPDIFLSKLGGTLTHAQVETLSDIEIGRRVMAEILRAATVSDSSANTQPIREAYLHHLMQLAT